MLRRALSRHSLTRNKRHQVHKSTVAATSVRSKIQLPLPRPSDPSDNASWDQKIEKVSLDNAFISTDAEHVQAWNQSLTNSGTTASDDGCKNPIVLSRFLAIKDNIATDTLPTSCASGTLQDYKSPFEATVVKEFARDGWIPTAKTNMDEFGMGSHSTNSYFGPVQVANGLSAGGSSGGSAVAVKSSQCDAALGTDTGGSIRLPAAYNGVVGYKPSYGMVSRWGVVPYANSLDTVGILARSVEDIRPFGDYDPQDPTSITNSTRSRIKDKLKEAKSDLPLRIGVPIEYNIQELDTHVRDSWIQQLEGIQSKGCTIIPISLPHTKIALSAYYVIAAAEAASNLSKYDGVRYGSRGISVDGTGDVLYSSTRGRLFGAEVKRRILLGSYTLSSEAIDNYFIQAQKIRRLVQRDFDSVFRLQNPLRPPQQFDLSDIDESISLENKLGPAEVDFILCPTAPTLPPSVTDVTQEASLNSYISDVFTVPASLAGLPVVNLSFGPPRVFPYGHKIGMQLIGQYSDDECLIQAAKKISRMLNQPKDWKKSAHDPIEKTSLL